MVAQLTGLRRNRKTWNEGTHTAGPTTISTMTVRPTTVRPTTEGDKLGKYLGLDQIVLWIDTGTRSSVTDWRQTLELGHARQTQCKDKVNYSRLETDIGARSSIVNWRQTLG